MENLVPEHKEGKKSDLSYERSFALREQAEWCFDNARKRLLNPRGWHKLAGILSAEFIPVQKENIDPCRFIQFGDYLKIDVPGPGPGAGKGYDWVLVERLEDESDKTAASEKIGVRLRPCSNPDNSNGDTAHFFTSSATSTFIIGRNGNKVTAYYHGRNEVPNVKTERKLDNIRNAIVGSGAWASLSEVHWNSLIKGFLEDEKER